jgi:hypothetical protein
MKSKQNYLMQQIKKEIENLFASSKIQNIFEESFKQKNPTPNRLLSLNNFSPSKVVPDPASRPHFTIRKRSMDFKEKGLIVPSTNLSYTPFPTQTYVSVSQLQSPTNYIGPNQISTQNISYSYGTPLRVVPVMPALPIFQSNQQMKFPNMQSMNIVNNFTNIQNFSNQKEPKNVHVYRLEDALNVKKKPASNIFNVQASKENKVINDEPNRRLNTKIQSKLFYFQLKLNF